MSFTHADGANEWITERKVEMTEEGKTTRCTYEFVDKTTDPGSTCRCKNMVAEDAKTEDGEKTTTCKSHVYEYECQVCGTTHSYAPTSCAVRLVPNLISSERRTSKFMESASSEFDALRVRCYKLEEQAHQPVDVRQLVADQVAHELKASVVALKIAEGRIQGLEFANGNIIEKSTAQHQAMALRVSEAISLKVQYDALKAEHAKCPQAGGSNVFSREADRLKDLLEQARADNQANEERIKELEEQLDAAVDGDPDDNDPDAEYDEGGIDPRVDELLERMAKLEGGIDKSPLIVMAENEQLRKHIAYVLDGVQKVVEDLETAGIRSSAADLRNLLLRPEEARAQAAAAEHKPTVERVRNILQPFFKQHPRAVGDLYVGHKVVDGVGHTIAIIGTLEVPFDVADKYGKAIAEMARPFVPEGVTINVTMQHAQLVAAVQAPPAPPRFIGNPRFKP